MNDKLEETELILRDEDGNVIDPSTIVWGTAVITGEGLAAR